MSLLKWSTPERRRGTQILPIVPNEIYIHIFEHLAPPIGRLTPDETHTFSKLSLVCRFFANFCLPRIFEHVEFSGTIYHPDTSTAQRNNDSGYETSRVATLCTQIAAKQPLALLLAKQVRFCDFVDWCLDDASSWAIRLFATKYISSMLHMTNIRELKFSKSFVDVEHWHAIASLESLELLTFDCCTFLGGPTDDGWEKRVPVRARVPRLHVTQCRPKGYHQPMAAIDPLCLQALRVDSVDVHQVVDWFPQSAMTELDYRVPMLDREHFAELHAILKQAPQSVTTLSLVVVLDRPSQENVQDIFDAPVWQNLSLLRSLTVQVWISPYYPVKVASNFLDGIRLLKGLQAFTLRNLIMNPVGFSSEILPILRDKFSAGSSLRCVDIFEKEFRFVDGEWSEVSSTAA